MPGASATTCSQMGSDVCQDAVAAMQTGSNIAFFLVLQRQTRGHAGIVTQQAVAF
jgi:hypothetical protein